MTNPIESNESYEGKKYSDWARGNTGVDPTMVRCFKCGRRTDNVLLINTKLICTRCGGKHEDRS